MNTLGHESRASGTEMLNFLADLDWSSLPEDAPGAARRALLDNLACGIFGSQFPWARITADLAEEEGSTGRATLFGRSRGVAPTRAALSNGTSIHGIELDDIILGSLAHPGAVVVSAALAIAEQRDASGDRLLLGIIAGYEAMARVGAALGAACNTAGFHTTSVAGPIAAALAAGVVAGAPADVIARAVGIACSSASGIKAFTQGTGGMVKRFHAGRGSEGGVLAWQLAERGFTGPLQAIDGRYGLLEVIGGPTARPELLSAGLGENWAIGRVWTKVFPCCGLIHTTAQALESIRREAGLAAQDIKAVRIGVGARAVDQNGDTDPRDTMNAQYSIPFCAALALTGDVRDPNAYMPERLGDAAVQAMIPRIELHTDPEVDEHFPDRFGAKVEVRTTDGRVFQETAWYAHGTAVDPCTDAEISEKFRKMSAGLMSDDAAAEVEHAVASLGSGGTVADLTRALHNVSSGARR